MATDEGDAIWSPVDNHPFLRNSSRDAVGRSHEQSAVWPLRIKGGPPYVGMGDIAEHECNEARCEEPHESIWGWTPGPTEQRFTKVQCLSFPGGAFRPTRLQELTHGMEELAHPRTLTRNGRIITAFWPVWVATPWRGLPFDRRNRPDMSRRVQLWNVLKTLTELTLLPETSVEAGSDACTAGRAERMGSDEASNLWW
jgi:hypothetical protein